MGFGLIGIFIVTGVIIGVVALLDKLNLGADKKQD